MKSAVYSQIGSPPDVLSSTETARPEPGAGQVLVRMVLSPVHNHDLMTIAGQYAHKPALPDVPGTEAVGVVEALGDGVSNLTIGQRVAGGAMHTWAEYYVADAARLVPVPDNVSDETACQLVSMPLSAKMLLESLGVEPGQWIVQNAANGAVGKLVARYGAERGINVLGLVRRADAVAAMTEIGIANVVATDDPEWVARAKALTRGAPVVRAIDSLGGDGPIQLLEIASDGAELISFGAMSERPLSISAADLLFRGIIVKGFWGSKPPVKPQRIGELLGELIQDAAAGKLVLPIEASYPIEQVAEAARASGEPGRKGKIAIRGS
ncbi:MAG: zinc-binding dehydrogenase [Devosia sp.]|jgi:NADPH:quinone reductase-like Zn-dependent oxidoreductase|uniref:zinc-binding dehydrogenase n=1 Tax=unclassified Devosia TaxID=196773 RepID=UPI001A08CEE8|nr:MULTISPECIES: zinc-binding dehydrogenase [unclassified Devosia]MBF0679039.1 zinc-binding dehydrogenase [Devosia sp.]WEJ33653.1 zinc-binding dehydrogenase [Devosia sp. SD17-2]